MYIAITQPYLTKKKKDKHKKYQKIRVAVGVHSGRRRIHADSSFVVHHSLRNGAQMQRNCTLINKINNQITCKMAHANGTFGIESERKEKWEN